MIIKYSIAIRILKKKYKYPKKKIVKSKYYLVDKFDNKEETFALSPPGWNLTEVTFEL